MVTDKARGSIGAKTEHPPQHSGSYCKPPTFSKEIANFFSGVCDSCQIVCEWSGIRGGGGDAMVMTCYSLV